MASLVSVMKWLEWTSLGNIDVFGLIIRQDSELGAQLWKMQCCNLLVQVLGQHVHLPLVLAALALIPELQLGDHLHQCRDFLLT